MHGQLETKLMPSAGSQLDVGQRCTQFPSTKFDDLPFLTYGSRKKWNSPSSVVVILASDTSAKSEALAWALLHLMFKNKKIASTNMRRGAAAVEFAVVLPLISLLLLGAVEGSHSVIVSHSLVEAAQAGCRLYALPDHSQSDVENIIAASLGSRLSSKCTVTYDPANKSDVDTTLEPISVTVSVACDDIALVPLPYFANRTLQATVTLPADLNN